MAKEDLFEEGKQPAAEKPAVNADKLKALRAAMDKIEKNYGKGSIMTVGDESVENIEVIPTGSIALNAALGVGGYPKGRVIEIYGPERRSNLVLDYFYAHLVSFDIVAVFQFTDAADIQTNRGIKLQRITAGCRFGIAEHHANLVTQLVDEYTCRVSLIDRSRQLTKCLGH